MFNRPWFADYERYGPHFSNGTSNWPRHLLDQHLGLVLTSNDRYTGLDEPVISIPCYFRPWRRQVTDANKDTGSRIDIDKDKFKVYIDVKQFTPEEIEVKRGAGYVIVEAKHDEKPDEHGSISRQFMRRYTLPKDIDEDTVTSRLSFDGVLTITALKKNVGERIIPIQYDPVPLVNTYHAQEENGTVENGTGENEIEENGTEEKETGEPNGYH